MIVRGDNVNELISVIVPVYKVEKYLKRCVESIISQKYKNLEIILVDDGSPDSCGQMCDDYTEKDNRVKVIHKKNGGLSDARNAGLDIANGVYVTFVDSDDILNDEYITRLYENLISAKADISCCDLARIKESEKVESTSKGQVKVFDSLSAIEETLYQRFIDNSACAKLYKKNLFDRLKYPKNKYFEDLDTTYKLFLQAKKIVATDEKLYYYIQREGSILHKLNDRVISDLIKVIEDLNKNLKSFESLNEAVLARTINAHFYIVRNSDNKKFVKDSKTFIKKNRSLVLKNNNISNKTKYGILCSYLGFGVVNLIYKLKR